MKDRVNLFIVGSPKCGTTSLALALDGLDSCFLPNIKEPNFFLNSKSTQLAHCIQTPKKYKDIYKKSSGEKYLIDSSTSYFVDSKSPNLIKKYNKEAKIIVLIRDPINRMISHYKMEKNTYLRERNSVKNVFSENYKKEYFGMNINPYIENSLYRKHLDKWVDVFGKRLLVCTIEDPLLENKIIDFLNIESFKLSLENNSKIIRHPFFNYLLKHKASQKLRFLLNNQTKSFIKKFIFKTNRKQEFFNINEDIDENVITFLYQDREYLSKKYNVRTDLWKIC